MDQPPISKSAKAFLKNLCLRDFGYHVLFHHPAMGEQPLIPHFRHFPWAESDEGFQRWREGTTGYPLVDAAMRQLRTTGWVHNTLRFLLASFLVKYTLQPWTLGLNEFFSLLIDGDFSSNALGWQWTAGCNTDAFPFTCLVNPVGMSRRQDPSGVFVRRWLPELAKLPARYIHKPWAAPPDVLAAAGVKIGPGGSYPLPVVDASFARARVRESMRVMKSIITGSMPQPTRFAVSISDMIQEWPEEEESAAEGGDRGGLLSIEGALPAAAAAPAAPPAHGRGL